MIAAAAITAIILLFTLGVVIGRRAAIANRLIETLLADGLREIDESRGGRT